MGTTAEVYLREMTKTEINVRAALQVLMRNMEYADALTLLMNEMVAGAIHRGTPRDVVEKVFDAVWKGHLELHLPKKEGAA